MLDLGLVLPVIINILALSVPEQLFLIVFTFILMRRFDLLELKRYNIIRIITASLVPALVSNILGGFIKLDMNYVPLIGIAVTMLMIVTVFKLFSVKDIAKVFLSVFISFMTIMAIKLLYIPFIIYGTELSMEALNKPGGPILILSIVDRAVQLFIISFVIYKKKSFLKVNVFQLVYKNITLSVAGIFVILFNLAFLFIISKSIYIDKLLLSLDFKMQLASIVIVILLPFLNIVVYFSILYHVSNKESQERFHVQEELKVSINDIRFFLKRRQYDKIHRETNYLEEDTNELYKEQKNG